MKRVWLRDPICGNRKGGVKGGNLGAHFDPLLKKFVWNFKSLTHDISNKLGLDATFKAWVVPFPAIWEAFFAKFSIYTTRQPVALRLDSVIYYLLSAPGNPPPPLCTQHPQPPLQCFGGNRKSIWAPLPPPPTGHRPIPGSITVSYDIGCAI